MKDKSILIVCDDLDYVLIDSLLRECYLLKRIQGQKEILKCVEDDTYDLLLVDISFLKQDSDLKQWSRKIRVPIVALTSDPYDCRSKNLKEMGCIACFVKPIRSREFALFIDKWINN